MPNQARVTVTLPEEVVRDIDRLEQNRSRFVLEAVQHELRRRRREELRRSLRSPHPEASVVAEAGFDEWGARLHDEDTSGLLDPRAGKSVRWVRGEGWVEERK
jgi:hypothetical protein